MRVCDGCEGFVMAVGGCVRVCDGCGGCDGCEDL